MELIKAGAHLVACVLTVMAMLFFSPDPKFGRLGRCQTAFTSHTRAMPLVVIG